MRVCVLIFVLCFFCVLLLSEICISVFRNAEVPIVGILDYRNSEVPKIGILDYRSAVMAFRISDLSNKGISVLPMYIKASEFQSSSVYCWSSLEEDLPLLIQ